MIVDYGSVKRYMTTIFECYQSQEVEKNELIFTSKILYSYILQFLKIFVVTIFLI